MTSFRTKAKVHNNEIAQTTTAKMIKQFNCQQKHLSTIHYTYLSYLTMNCNNKIHKPKL